MAKHLLCLLGLHRYGKIGEQVSDSGCVTEKFICYRCTKTKTHSYNPNARHRCGICGELEQECECPFC